jgi:copper chaperone CopZ
MTTIRIEGMSCMHCVRAVTEALEGIAGIRDVRVDLATGQATFTEEAPVDRAVIGARIAEAGYQVVG